MGQFYVYVHFRLDRNTPFYVGKGKALRAWSRKDRNEHWRRVVTLHGYYVCIYQSGLDEPTAFFVERDLIATLRGIHGKSLCNVADGGEGCARASQTADKKKQIQDLYADQGRLPHRRGVEHPLHVWLCRYCNQQHPSYDSVFHSWAIQAGFGKDTESENKEKIREFYCQQGRLPQEQGEEKALFWRMRSYCSKRQSCYDPEFDAWARERGWAKHFQVASAKKDEIKVFYATHGRLPRATNSDADERFLSFKMTQYCSKSQDIFDPEFRSWAESVGYGSRKRR